MPVTVQFSHVQDFRFSLVRDLVCLPRRGEEILHEGTYYLVKRVVHDLDLSITEVHLADVSQ